MFSRAYAAYQSLLASGKTLNGKAIGEVSDLFIQVEEVMRFQVPAGLCHFGDPITSEEFLNSFREVINDFDIRLEATGRVEDAYDLRVTTLVADERGSMVPVESVTRLRMTVYRHARGTKLAAVVRFTPEFPKPLQDLALETMARSLLDDLRGAILVTGPTHSGKTNTMASMMDFINASREGHIVTIEDPIEIPIPPRRCVISQMEIGSDVLSFASGVNGSMRQSPIAVMVGEIRDSETAQAALRVVQAGHFLLAGLHGSDALGALRAYCSFLDPNRLSEERAQLAQRLNGVIYQALVCSKDGKKRWAACEVISFLANPALRMKLAKGEFDNLSAILQSTEEKGVLSLNRSLCRLVLEGKVTFEDAKLATYDPPGLIRVAKEVGIKF